MKLGERTVELIEQNVKHNMDDIRELKKRVNRSESDIHDLKTNQQVSNQTMSHIMESLNDLKSNFKVLDEKIQTSNDEQLKQYKTAVWQVGGTIIATIIGAAFLFILGL